MGMDWMIFAYYPTAGEVHVPTLTIRRVQICAPWTLLRCSYIYSCSQVFLCSLLALQDVSNVVCPTLYRTRHFFNNSPTNEDIATKFEADYRHITLHFSQNERTSFQISLQYLHCCWNY